MVATALFKASFIHYLFTGWIMGYRHSKLIVEVVR